MKAFQPLILFFFLLALGVPDADFAGTETTAFPPNQPIETRVDLGFLDLFGGGLNYSVEGKPIRRYEDFRDLIYPLRDEEASRFIRDAQEEHFAAWMLYVSGAAAGVDVALVFKPVPLLRVDWFDRVATGAVAAEVFWTAGVLLDQAAEGRKYNAVQRYNQLIQKKNEAFLELKPQVTLAQEGPRLGLSCDF